MPPNRAAFFFAHREAGDMPWHAATIATVLNRQAIQALFFSSWW
jgi:hypothetical protein